MFVVNPLDTARAPAESHPVTGI
ncbi:hypothetical protein MARINON1_52017 [Marinobacter salarius]|nr:hypothetical protein MARINON1_52017 [Marinobacter salarius]